MPNSKTSLENNHAIRANRALQASIRRARWVIWWRRYDGFVYLGVALFISALLGAMAMSLVDRAERVALIERQAEDVRELRRYYSEQIRDRNRSVLESANTASDAAETAVKAAKIASDMAAQKTGKPTPAPAVEQPTNRKEK